MLLSFADQGSGNNEIAESKKEDLQIDQVNPEIWLNIEHQVIKRKRSRRIRLIEISAAASVALLMVFVLTGYLTPQSKNADLLAEFEKQNKHYPDLIYAKTNALRNTKVQQDYQDELKILIDQLEFLDKQYQEYLRYIEKNGYQQFIGQQLANNYKTKIELLDKINSEIEKINFYETTSQEKSPLVNLKL